MAGENEVEEEERLFIQQFLKKLAVEKGEHGKPLSAESLAHELSQGAGVSVSNVTVRIALDQGRMGAKVRRIVEKYMGQPLSELMRDAGGGPTAEPQAPRRTYHRDDPRYAAIEEFGLTVMAERPEHVKREHVDALHLAFGQLKGTPSEDEMAAKLAAILQRGIARAARLDKLLTASDQQSHREALRHQPPSEGSAPKDGLKDRRRPSSPR